jgi:hypothetical protein
MSPYGLSIVEKIVLILVASMLITGFILFYTNIPFFNWYVQEDHLVEWLTVLGLVSGCFVCLSRFFKLFRYKTGWFLTVTFLLGLLLFVAAGEEVSWGQRILGLKSPEYFQKHNAQGETNLHNLVVGGVKLNKLIFSTILSIAMGIYLIVFPIVRAKNKTLKNFLDSSGIPVPRLYQVISFILLFIITSLLQHEKNAELLECGAALLFFLIIRYPANPQIFKRRNNNNR